MLFFFFPKESFGFVFVVIFMGVSVIWVFFVCCGGFCLFVLFLPEVSEGKPVKSVNLRAHREQSNIKRNVHIHVPILDVNELAE